MKRIIILCLLFLPLILQAQQYDNIWTMGKFSAYHHTATWRGNTKVNFSTSIPHFYYDSISMDFFVTNTTMSDPNTGRILFYTNGIYIADSTNQKMRSGDSINYGVHWLNDRDEGYMLIQGAFVLPKPNSTTQYYLIHQLYDTFLINSNGSTIVSLYSTKTYYTLIDMTLNNGKGAVVRKNQTNGL